MDIQRIYKGYTISNIMLNKKSQSTYNQNIGIRNVTLSGVEVLKQTIISFIK